MKTVKKKVNVAYIDAYLKNVGVVNNNKVKDIKAVNMEKLDIREHKGHKGKLIDIYV